MFCVTEAAVDAIRRAFDESGELGAIAELQRHYPLLADREVARACMLAIVGWRPAGGPAVTGSPQGAA